MVTSLNIQTQRIIGVEGCLSVLEVSTRLTNKKEEKKKLLRHCHLIVTPTRLSSAGMPPPTAGDPWLSGRHFGIVIDAGSSGSRIQIYSWTNAAIALRSGHSPRSLPKVEKGTKIGEEWVKKVTPGASLYYTK